MASGESGGSGGLGGIGMSRWTRNAVLVAAGGGFMLGFVFLANPGHYGLIGALAGGVLSAGMVVVAIRAYRAD